MKKAILSMSALALTCAGMFAAIPNVTTSGNMQLQAGTKLVKKAPMKSTRAENEVTFSYSQGIGGAYGFNGSLAGAGVYQAFQVDPAVLKQMAGNKISAISTVTGSNSNETGNPDRAITVFLTTDLTKAPFYTQDFQRSSKAYTEEKVVLTTPQEFDPEQPLYVGYKFTANANTSYCLVADGIPTSAPASYYSVINGGSEGTPAEWMAAADQIGALCISCTFSGENIPEVMTVPLSMTTNSFVKSTTIPSFAMSVANCGLEKIESLTVHVEATDEQPYDIDMKAENPLEGVISFTFEAPQAYTTLGTKEVKVSISKVNGKENAAAASAVTASTLVADKLFTRTPVFEVGTGSWCAWCPRSLATLDYLRNNYPDTVIGIAYHSTGGGMGVDNMSNKYSEEWCNYMNVPGFPTAYVNRIEDGAEVSNNNCDALDAQLKAAIETGSPAEAVVNSMEVADDNKSAKVSATFRFAGDLPSDDYAVSVVVIQNNVGPFNQKNNYAGGRAGKLFGWENEKSTVKYTYNEVAVYASGFPGKAVTSEAQLKGGQDYTLDFNVSMKPCTTVDETPQYDAIAMVCNAKTGEILNAARLYKAPSAVNNIASDLNKAQINVADGNIYVSNAANVAIYTLDGVKVANGSAEGLAAGVYIVKADDLVKKVMVK